MMHPRPLADLMREAGRKARELPPPERYLWCAVWWHLYSRETKVPAQCIGYAKNQLRLARDMAARPDHFKRKPLGTTDFEWSQIAPAQQQIGR